MLLQKKLVEIKVLQKQARDSAMKNFMSELKECTTLSEITKAMKTLNV